MRLRPYRKSTDFEYIKKWITDERTHALWCANLIPYPLRAEGLHKVLEQNEKDLGECAYTFINGIGHPIGFCAYSINEDDNSGFLKFVLIDNELRGKGYGNQMINLLLQYAFTITGVSTVKLNVFDVNINAKRCYKKAGFLEVENTQNAF